MAVARLEPAPTAHMVDLLRQDGDPFSFNLTQGAGQVGCSLAPLELRMDKPLTATAVEKMRRWAKQRAREAAIPYGKALEDAARAAGFSSWHHVRKAIKAAAGNPDDAQLPVDPVLPADFDSTPNEQRSQAELDTWWLRPFVQTRPDGSLDVRVLDGGAWDRATYYGTAKDMEEARAIARAGLERWQKVRDTPFVFMGRGSLLVVLEPNRPGMPRPVLFAGGTGEAVAAFRGRWAELSERDPQSAALMLRAARERSARIPTYDQVESAAARAADCGLVAQSGRAPEFQELALLVTLFSLRERDGSQVRFTLPELSLYMWEFGVDEGNVQDVFARAQELQVDGSRAITDSKREFRDGLDHWTVRLGSYRWLPARRRGKA